MTEMKIYKAIFACVLVAIILVPVSFDRDPAGHGPGLILSWTESRAGAGKADLSGKAGLPNSRPADANGGSIGSHLTPLEVLQLLASHNRAREEVGLSPLVWSNVLAAYAQKWADHLASTSGLMEHRPHSGRWKQEHGENLFMGTAGYYGVSDAVIAWERERPRTMGGLSTSPMFMTAATTHNSSGKTPGESAVQRYDATTTSS